MNFTVFTLDNQKVGCVDANITPFVSGFFIALNLKLGHSSITVVINLQAEIFNFIEGQHFFQESLLKATISTVGQIMERTVFVCVRTALRSECCRHGRVAGFFEEANGFFHFGIKLQLALIILDNVFYHALRRIIVCGLVGIHFGSEVCDVQKICFFGYQLFGSVKVKLIAEVFADICFYQPAVIVRTVITRTVFFKSYFLIHSFQLFCIFHQLCNCGRAKSAFHNSVYPRIKGGRFGAIFCIINGDTGLAFIHGEVSGFDNTVCKACGISRNRNIACRISFFDCKGIIIDFELIKINFRKFQMCCTVITLQRCFAIISRRKLLERDMMLLFKLYV